MKKRVFVALRISEALQRGIALWEEKHGAFPVRWISSKDLHCTLIPPWYVDDPKALIRQLSRMPISVVPFDITFHTVASGPDSKRPRLLWAVCGKSKEAEKLKHILEVSLGQKKEKRDFIIHVTLSRFRRVVPELIAFHENIQWKDTE